MSSYEISIWKRVISGRDCGTMSDIVDHALGDAREMMQRSAIVKRTDEMPVDTEPINKAASLSASLFLFLSFSLSRIVRE